MLSAEGVDMPPRCLASDCWARSWWLQSTMPFPRSRLRLFIAIQFCQNLFSWSHEDRSLPLKHLQHPRWTCGQLPANEWIKSDWESAFVIWWRIAFALDLLCALPSDTTLYFLFLFCLLGGGRSSSTRPELTWPKRVNTYMWHYSCAK